MKITKVKSLKTNSTAGTDNQDFLKEVTKLSNAMKKFKGDGKGVNSYPLPFKQKAIDIHYKYGITNTVLAKHIGVADVTIGDWKRRLGNDMTHISYGNTTRNDIRTKCLAVNEYKNKNVSKEHLADKYHVGKGTITAWLNQYSKNYKEYITQLPDGVIQIAKEERLIFGEENIKQAREFQMMQRDELRDLIQQMQKHGIMANATAQARKRCDTAEENIEILEKANEIIRKRKS